MKIIKHGNQYGEFKNRQHEKIKKTAINYHFICTNCGCEFTMTNIELMKEQQSIVFITATQCPECKTMIKGVKINL